MIILVIFLEGHKIKYAMKSIAVTVVCVLHLSTEHTFGIFMSVKCFFDQLPSNELQIHNVLKS